MLEHALGQVLSDREAGDVRPRIGRGDAVRAAADHDDELDLPVEVPAGMLDLRVGAR